MKFFKLIKIPEVAVGVVMWAAFMALPILCIYNLR